MYKRRISIVAGPLVVLSLLGAGCFQNPTQPSAPEEPAETQPAATSTMSPEATATSTAPSAIELTREISDKGQTFQTIHLKGSTDKAQIDLSYPEMIGSYPAETIAAFNQAVSSSVNGFLVDFTNNLTNADNADTNPAGPWELSVDANITLRSPEVISVFGAGSVYTGGAHPNTFYIHVLFDVKNNKTLTTKDLFSDPAKALPILSDRSIGKLKSLNATGNFSDDAWITSGAGPQWVNYDIAYLTRTGIEVVFPPYQVAAYAAGEQGVTFPYSELSNILLPRFSKVADDVSLWETYTDEANGFSYKLPQDLAGYNGAHVSYRSGTRVVTLPNDAIVNGCLMKDGSGNPYTKLEGKTVSGIFFCHTMGIDAGMMQRDRTDNFTAVKGTTSVTVSFQAHYVADPAGVIDACMHGKSSEEICKTFDEKADTTIYQQIIQTFRFTK